MHTKIKTLLDSLASLKSSTVQYSFGEFTLRSHSASMRGCGTGGRLLHRLVTRSFEHQRVPRPQAFTSRPRLSAPDTPPSIAQWSSSSSTFSVAPPPRSTNTGNNNPPPSAPLSIAASHRPFSSSSVHARARGSGVMAGSAWDGSGTQEELMYRDECILVVSTDPTAIPPFSSPLHTRTPKKNLADPTIRPRERRASDKQGVRRGGWGGSPFARSFTHWH